MRLSGGAAYYIALLLDLVVGLAFFARGARTFDGGPSAAAVLVVTGVWSYSLLEYVVHRWVLHGPPSLATRGHAQHHAQPAALVATPPFVVPTVAVVIWTVIGRVVGPAASALVVSGLYAGYNYFALLHHWEHHHRRIAYRSYWRDVDRAHRAHHRRQTVNFGVSTTVWDRVFGTYFRVP